LKPRPSGKCSHSIVYHDRSVDEEVEGDFEPVEGLGKALASSVETRKIVSDTAVGTLYEMRLTLGHRARFREAHARERDVVATI
jgi:hypothetical protein